MANLTTTGTSGYPNSVDTSTTLVNGVTGDEIIAENVNGPTAAVINIETELGTLPKGTSADLKTRLATALNGDGTIKSSVIAAATGTTVTYAAGVFSIIPVVARGHLSGFQFTVASGSNTTTIDSGVCADATSSDYLTLAASLQKTTATWVVGTGNGGLDTGAVAASTWYHWHAIKRSDTGAVDVLFSTSVASPTLPASYNLSRRIASNLTNATGQWTSFIHDGDYFRWSGSVLDVNATNPGTAAATATLTVPTGINVQALVNLFTSGDGSVSQTMYLSDLAVTDEAPSDTAAPLGTGGPTASAGGSWSGKFGQLTVRTNKSAQIRYRAQGSNANTIIRIATLGWWDRRGRDA